MPFRASQQVTVPGSLETTVNAVQALGREALPVRMDVLDRGSMDEVITRTLEAFGRIDVLVNNALYQGPGLMHAFADFTFEQLEKSVLGNLVNQAYMARKVLPVMIRQGGGYVVSLSSNAAVTAPSAPPDKGGWGFVYAAPKAGNRIAEFIVEHAKDGIVAFNVEPGFTVTGRPWPCSVRMRPRISAGIDPARPLATWWLCRPPGAKALAGTLISSPGFFAAKGIKFP